jgi:hypothetical protein
MYFISFPNSARLLVPRSSLAQTLTFVQPLGELVGMVISLDGCRIATGNYDGTILIWDAARFLGRAARK